VFEPVSAYSGFSVDDVPAAAQFWGGVLGLRVTPLANGTMLQLELPGAAATVLLYGKDDHRPADFTVLNLVVHDLDAALADLAARGLAPDPGGPWADEDQVVRGRASGRGPDIAWFHDPAGNVFSVQQQ
jgi:catechol 2,3-dioxygenase-like lactoylglutathione lyase family enzyme